MKIDINKINGNEVIEFLNKQTHEDAFDDVNICYDSFTFDSQKVDKNTYKLYFSMDYNNWGTNQEIDGNELHISQIGVSCRTSEPFEGDGTDEAIAEQIENWIEKHEFKSNPEDEFRILMEEIYEMLPQIAFNDTKAMQEQINNLIAAKTYMK